MDAGSGAVTGSGSHTSPRLGRNMTPQASHTTGGSKSSSSRPGMNGSTPRGIITAIGTLGETLGGAGLATIHGNMAALAMDAEIAAKPVVVAAGKEGAPTMLRPRTELPSSVAHSCLRRRTCHVDCRPPTSKFQNSSSVISPLMTTSCFCDSMRALSARLPARTMLIRYHVSGLRMRLARYAQCASIPSL